MANVQITVILDRETEVPDHGPAHVVVYPSLHVDSWLIVGGGLNTERGHLSAAMATVGQHIEKLEGA
jgi:hypothetical protein